MTTTQTAAGTAPSLPVPAAHTPPRVELGQDPATRGGFTRGTPMRTCSRCSGFFLAHAAHYDDEPYFCPKCWPKFTEGFDPQAGDRVRDIDRMSGPFSEIFVVARDGDTVTVQPLGFPDRRRDVPIGQLARTFA